MPGSPPLEGLKVIEFAGLAPGPFAGLILADAGASVLRIDRPSPASPPAPDLLARRKASAAVDIRSAGGAALVRALARRAAVLIDPFRPGVLERLGLGPDALRAANPRLVFARLTGFRRDDGAWAHAAGHDVNYLAVSGVLALLGGGGAGRPTPPANLLADFAGGGAVLVLGILLALLARGASGRGQVVEASMVDGAAYLATAARLMLKTPAWDRPRGENLLDGGAPFYDTYETKDGRWVAVGALEPRFFAKLVEGMGLAGEGWEERQYDRECWEEMRKRFVEVFRGRTRDEWEAEFQGSDACCTPIYEFREMERQRNRLQGDQRPIVSLSETSLLPAQESPAGTSRGRGQGPGAVGDGYNVVPLQAGDGAEEMLSSWMGWRKGKDFDVQDGGLILTSKARL